MQRSGMSISGSITSVVTLLASKKCRSESITETRLFASANAQASRLLLSNLFDTWSRIKIQYKSYLLAVLFPELSCKINR